LDDKTGFYITGSRKSVVNKVLINKGMRSESSYEWCMGVGMTPMQREVFLVVDEWWKEYGYGPSIRDICEVRGKMGLGSTKRIIDRLVRLGVLKRVERMGRTVRPVYINFRTLK
jgi:SOS-response transcriptional repressor LexA